MQSVNGEQYNKTINITFLFLSLGAAAVPVSATVIFLQQVSTRNYNHVNLTLYN